MQTPRSWEHVVRKVRTGFMPPAGEPRPERATLDALAAALEQRLDAAARAAPNAGFKGVSRLNRAEYANAVRDLLAYDAGAIVATLPADDAIQGFDNVAAALTVSPTLIESYTTAALKISRAAVGDRSQGATQVSYEAPGGSQARHVDGLPLGTRGGFKLTHDFPLDATYELRVRARGPGPLAGQRFCPPPRIDVTLDGQPLAVADPAAIRIEAAAGPRTLTVALLDERRCEGVNELFGVYAPGGGIAAVEIHGPFDATGVGATPSRRAIFSCPPPVAGDEVPCAREILTRLATHAYRRPVDPGGPEVGTLLRFYEQGRRDGDFETGIERTRSRACSSIRSSSIGSRPSPKAWRRARATASATSSSRRACRSFFGAAFPTTSCSPPRPPAGCTSRPRSSGRCGACSPTRARPRSSRTSPAQWLKLRELDDALPQDAGFDAQLRALVSARDRAAVRARAARGSQRARAARLRVTRSSTSASRATTASTAWRGSYFRRVELREDSPRGGLLGLGSILTATSVANRTSPVVRGAWIVENLLGAEVPPPPPGVEADLSGARSPAEAKTLRQRMEAHRTTPVCAACHQLIDPFGFALENFDLVGRWRTSDAGEPIDATALLVDGTPVDGPAALRARAARPLRRVRHGVDGKAPDLCARPDPRSARQAGRAPHRRGGGCRRLSILERCDRHRR